ncbi:MAG TPA: START domain-containing protein, partial [Flavipsychrobacter sp.]|nr:START domain-containing protein [Flavipsychrobacter sp.]
RQFVKRAIISLLLLFTLSNVYAGDKWELKKDEDGIKVYTANTPGSNLKAIRAEFITKGTPAKLAAILLNVNSQKDWVYSTKSAAIVKRISENEIIYYSEKSMPWPVSNRDVVMDLKISQDKVSGYMTVNISSVNNLVAVKKNIVRVPSSNATWKVTPINNSTMKIEYEGQADPGGSIPAWITNMFISKGALETFRKLKVILEKQ